MRLEPGGVAIGVGGEQLGGQRIAAEIVRKCNRALAPGSELGPPLGDQRVFVPVRRGIRRGLVIVILTHSPAFRLASRN